MRTAAPRRTCLNVTGEFGRRKACASVEGEEREESESGEIGNVVSNLYSLM